MKTILSIFTISLSLFLMACTSSNNSDKLQVVTTTTMIGDLVEVIGQDKVEVTKLMEVGVDPHQYNPKLSDTLAINKSQLVVFNGLHLEGKMAELLENVQSDKLSIGDVIVTKGTTIVADEDVDSIDPHVWFDVTNWIIAAEAVKDKLVKLDAENSDYYENNATNYIKSLEALDLWIFNRVNELEANERVLVTAHDAFGYFANRYGFEVASVQGISTDSEPSIKDINAVIDLIIEKNVRSIFIETSIPETVLNQVVNGAAAREHEVSIGDSLYADSLGEGEHSQYLEAMKHNVNAIVEGLKK